MSLKSILINWEKKSVMNFLLYLEGFKHNYLSLFLGKCYFACCCPNLAIEVAIWHCLGYS